MFWVFFVILHILYIVFSVWFITKLIKFITVNCVIFETVFAFACSNYGLTDLPNLE